MCGHVFTIRLGTVFHGLQYTPDGKYVVYPLGAMIVIRNLATETQVSHIMRVAIWHTQPEIGMQPLPPCGVSHDTFLSPGFP